MGEEERQGWVEQVIEERLASFPPARELRIAAQNLINVNLEHALLLSIILAHEETYPWFYENYVQLFSLRLFRRYVAGIVQLVPEAELRGDERDEIILQFALRPGSFWLRECYLKKFLWDDPEHILRFIVASINKGCYLRIEADEFYLPNKRRYSREHFVHPTLIYGYDNTTSTLHALGFNAQAFFTKLTFRYDDFSQAYASARALAQADATTRDDALVGLIKMRGRRARYPFNLDRFLQALTGYLSATFDSAKKYDLLNFLPPEIDVDATVNFGFKVYEHFEAGLQQLLRGQAVMDYKNIHLLYEHKRCLLETFRFIMADYQVGAPFGRLVEDFQRVVQQFHSMRWKYLRYTITHDTQLVAQLIEQIGAVKKDEGELLMRMHEQLQAACLRLSAGSDGQAQHQRLDYLTRGC
jgi:hypothetical protein